MSESLPAHARAIGPRFGETETRACHGAGAGHAQRPAPPTAAETTLEAGLLASSREVNFPVRCLPVRLSMHSGELRSDLTRLRRIGRGASLVTVAGAAPEFVMNDSTGFPFHPGRATSSPAGHLKQRKTPGTPGTRTSIQNVKVHGSGTGRACSSGGESRKSIFARRRRDAEKVVLKAGKPEKQGTKGAKETFQARAVRIPGALRLPGLQLPPRIREQAKHLDDMPVWNEAENRFEAL